MEKYDDYLSNTLRYYYSVLSFPLSMDQLMLLIQDMKAAINYFNNNFRSRPHYLVSGGSFSLVQLREQQFADKNGNVAKVVLTKTSLDSD